MLEEAHGARQRERDSDLSLFFLETKRARSRNVLPVYHLPLIAESPVPGLLWQEKKK